MLSCVVAGPFVTDWLIAIGTLSVVIVALFRDSILSLIFRPKLVLAFEAEAPGCHKIPMRLQQTPGRTFEANCYCFRVRVKNIGNRRAELIEVVASKLWKKSADGTFIRVSDFLPLNLVWANTNMPFCDAISSGLEKYCNLGHIIHPPSRDMFPGEDNPKLGLTRKQTIMSLHTQIKPNNLTHLIGPGEYRIELVIACANCEPAREILTINHTGQWFEDERKMLSEGVGISIAD